jgi:homopolymeric O-antigen transport system ATP-binding protein
MRDDCAIRVEAVSKKYCRTLRRSMIYGLTDISKNALGMRTHASTLRRDEFWALDDVSFEIERGAAVGLIGPNGSGKTSLLKMLAGVFWPDKGRISIRGKVGALIAVGAGFHPLLTGRENVYINGAILGMSRADINRNFDAIVEFADVGDFLDTPVKHYSSGMFVRLGFAVAVHCEPDIMLVDEVLAVGDRGFQTKCFRKMAELRKNGTTFVLVSHNMHTVAGFADWVAVLNHGKMERFDDVFEGVARYERSFLDSDDEGIERLLDGGEHIRFVDVTLGERELKPGDPFALTLHYECDRAYEDAVVDLVVYDGRDPNVYFQATNHAYQHRVDLAEGSHELSIDIGSIPLHGTSGKVTVAIWAKGRTEHLFWWRIPLQMASVPHATGRNFLPVKFGGGPVAGTDPE